MDLFVRFCEEFGVAVQQSALSVFEFVTKPVSQVFEDSILPDWVLEILPSGIYDYFATNSLVNIMFGVALPVFLGIVVAKFAIDFIRG